MDSFINCEFSRLSRFVLAALVLTVIGIAASIWLNYSYVGRMTESERAIQFLRRNGANISAQRVRSRSPSGVEIAFSKPEYFDFNLLRKIGNVTSLDLGGDKVTDKDLEIISRLSELKYLTIEYATMVTDAGAEKIAKIKTLAILALPHSRISDRGVEHLTKLSKLSCLDLRDSKITDTSIESISKFPKRATIILNGANQISKNGIAEIKRRRPDLTIEY